MMSVSHGGGCTLKQWLHPAVTKPEDRALFELGPNP
jgi:hypothetical protein